MKQRLLPLLIIALLATTLSSQIFIYLSAQKMAGFHGASVEGTLSLCVDVGPIFTPIPNLTIAVGDTFFFDVNITNDCGEAQVFFDNTSLFDIDPVTGVINFTANSSHLGSNPITIFVNETPGPFTFNTTFVLNVTTFFPPVLTPNRNPDGQSIDLNWTNVSAALFYNLYYSSNISALYTLNVSAIPSVVTKIANLTSINYTDSTAHLVQKRYYRVSAVSASEEKLSNTVGKFTFYYDVLNSSFFGPLASNSVAIYLNNTLQAEVFLQQIPAGLNPTISRLDKSDPNGEFFTTHVRGLNDGNDFTLNPTIGYRVTVDQPFNHTIVGGVFPPPLELQYDFLNSSVFGPLSSNWRGIYDFNRSYTGESFLQEIPGLFNPTISRLDKSDGSGEFFTTHVRGLNDGNIFDLLLGVGYILTVDGEFNHTLCTGIACYTGFES